MLRAFLFIPESSVSSDIAADNQHEAPHRVSYMQGAGWLFEWLAVPMHVWAPLRGEAPAAPTRDRPAGLHAQTT